MSVRSPSHIVVALPEGVAPSHEMSDVLIRKFIKACKKENIAENVFEKSLMVKRFERPSEIDRQRRMKAKRKAIREYNEAQKKDSDSKNSKSKKNYKDKGERQNG